LREPLLLTHPESQRWRRTARDALEPLGYLGIDAARRGDRAAADILFSDLPPSIATIFWVTISTGRHASRRLWVNASARPICS
jgi:hypothetical protein